MAGELLVMTLRLTSYLHLALGAFGLHSLIGDCVSCDLLLMAALELALDQFAALTV